MIIENKTNLTNELVHQLLEKKLPHYKYESINDIEQLNKVLIIVYWLGIYLIKELNKLLQDQDLDAEAKEYLNALKGFMILLRQILKKFLSIR